MKKLTAQATELHDTMVELVKRYQFRGRHETVARGLTVLQAYTLDMLCATTVSITMSELATGLYSSNSTMSRVVKQLAQRELLAQTRDVEDRRICYVHVTDKGRMLWSEVREQLIDIDARILATVSPSEREAVLAVMKRLCGAIDDWRASQK